MRTTLDLDDDVLLAGKEIARQRGCRLEECFRIWPANISIRDLVQPDTLITHSQVTDVFLLALAVHKGGKLATLDRRIATAAVQQGSEALELIAP
jgi:predicted nucleic acid-binding protein